MNGTTITYVGNYYEWKGSTSTMVKYYYAAGARVSAPMTEPLASRTGTALSLLSDHLGSPSYVVNNSETTETGEKRCNPRPSLLRF